MQSSATLNNAQSFWDKIAPKYAAKPVSDPQAYEQKLSRLRTLMRPEDRVLEMGCGTGSTALALADGVADYVATDISREMIRIAEGKRKRAPSASLRFVQADAVQRMPDAPFDVVSTFSFLHLAQDLPAVLRSAYDQLRPGGLFISKTVCLGDVNVLIRLFVRALRLAGIAPPITFLTKAQVKQALIDAGFDIVESRYFGKSRHNPFIVAQRPARGRG